MHVSDEPQIETTLWTNSPEFVALQQQVDQIQSDLLQVAVQVMGLNGRFTQSLAVMEQMVKTIEALEQRQE
jgi:hypothetical protein